MADIGKRSFPDLFAPIGVHIFEDDKMLAVSPLAKLLYIAATLRCKRKETDGEIKKVAIRSIAAEVGIYDGVDGLAQELVDGKLWKKSGEDWLIPPEVWGKWNDTKEEREAKAIANRVNGQKGGLKAAENRGVAGGIALGTAKAKKRLKPNGSETVPKEEKRREEKRREDTSCSEPSPASEPVYAPTEPKKIEAKPEEPEPEAVLEFPTVGGGAREWRLTKAKVAEYAESFPGIDVMAECRSARQWCIDNQARRKTHGGMPKFLSGWLSRAQNRAAANGHPRAGPLAKPPPDRTGTDAFLAECERREREIAEERAAKRAAKGASG